MTTQTLTLTTPNEPSTPSHHGPVMPPMSAATAAIRFNTAVVLVNRPTTAEASHTEARRGGGRGLRFDDLATIGTDRRAAPFGPEGAVVFHCEQASGRLAPQRKLLSATSAIPISGSGGQDLGQRR
jgi:hypothetical protein